MIANRPEHAEPPSKVFSYAGWNSRLATLAPQYRAAAPYPHIALDNFLPVDLLERALEEFPSPQSPEWIQYKHINEKKLGITDKRTYQPALRMIIEELQSERFLVFLTQLTGIEGLVSDETLEGGGLHQIEPGGFLNIHADFTVHPSRRTWKRRINLLLYLNKDWQDSYNGHLEMWDRQMQRCVHKHAPLFNRAVIFNTEADAFHGHPDPLASPPGVTRKSIALYYFTPDEHPHIRATNYRPRPNDDKSAALIHLDNLALRGYDFLKRRVGLSDKTMGRLLGWLGRSRK